MLSVKSEKANDQKVNELMTFITHRVEKMNNNGEEK
jgi:hypothetical protein